MPLKCVLIFEQFKIETAVDNFYRQTSVLLNKSNYAYEIKLIYFHQQKFPLKMFQCRMEGSDFTNYIRPLYNGNNNFNKFFGEDSNAKKFKALLSSLENFFKLLF